MGFFGYCGLPPLSPSRPWDENTVSNAFFSRQWKQYIEFQGLPSFHSNIMFFVTMEHLATLSDRAQDCWISGWGIFPSSSLPWFTINPTYSSILNASTMSFGNTADIFHSLYLQLRLRFWLLPVLSSVFTYVPKLRDTCFYTSPENAHSKGTK